MNIVICGFAEEAIDPKQNYYLIVILMDHATAKKAIYTSAFETACIGYGITSMLCNVGHNVSFSSGFLDNFKDDLEQIDPNWHTRFQHYEKSAAAATRNSNHRNKTLQ